MSGSIAYKEHGSQRHWACPVPVGSSETISRGQRRALFGIPITTKPLRLAREPGRPTKLQMRGGDIVI